MGVPEDPILEIVRDHLHLWLCPAPAVLLASSSSPEAPLRCLGDTEKFGAGRARASLAQEVSIGLALLGWEHGRVFGVAGKVSQRGPLASRSCELWTVRAFGTFACAAQLPPGMPTRWWPVDWLHLVAGSHRFSPPFWIFRCGASDNPIHSTVVSSHVQRDGVEHQHQA